MNDKPCLHEGGIEGHNTGGMHFSEGEPWDDFCQHGVCVICGKHVDCQSCCTEFVLHVASTLKEMKRPDET